jgi:hypothetical protein
MRLGDILRVHAAAWANPSNRAPFYLLGPGLGKRAAIGWVKGPADAQADWTRCRA